MILRSFLGNIVSALSLALVPAAVAQQGMVPPGATVHRTNAGELDATGWTIASSTEGEFEIKVRAKYTDFTVVEQKANQPPTTSFGVGAVSHEGVRFFATRIRYPEGMAQLHIEQMDRPPRSEGLSVTPIVFKGWQGRDVLARNPVITTRMRMFVVGQDLVVLSVQLPPQLDASSGSLVSVFFDSFRLVKK
jgi:hypothetical protein